MLGAQGSVGIQASGRELLMNSQIVIRKVTQYIWTIVTDANVIFVDKQRRHVCSQRRGE